MRGLMRISLLCAPLRLATDHFEPGSFYWGVLLEVGRSKDKWDEGVLAADHFEQGFPLPGIWKFGLDVLLMLSAGGRG
ncbi:MAG: hypothetical protein DDT34_01800 [Firmicutes bacterium]|nr:hypothetical protein [Bacillota bacterium]